MYLTDPDRKRAELEEKLAANPRFKRVQKPGAGTILMSGDPPIDNDPFIQPKDPESEKRFAAFLEEKLRSRKEPK